MRNIQKSQISPGFQKQCLEPSFRNSFTRSAALGGEWRFWLGLSLSLYLSLSLCDTKIASLYQIAKNIPGTLGRALNWAERILTSTTGVSLCPLPGKLKWDPLRDIDSNGGDSLGPRRGLLARR